MFLSPRESLQPHSAKSKAQSHQPPCLEKEKRTRQGSTHGGTLKRKSPRGQSAANIYRAKRVGVKMSGSDFEFGASGHTSNANFLLFRSRRPAANSKIYKDKPIKPGTQSESEFERRPSSSLWDTVIRVALIGGLPGASMDCSPNWQKAKAELHHSGDSGFVVNRPSDVAANEFIRRFRSPFRRSGATEHSPNTSSARGTKAVAGSWPPPLLHLVKGSCRLPCTRSEHPAKDCRFGPAGAIHRSKRWREHVVVLDFFRRGQCHYGLRRLS